MHECIPDFVPPWPLRGGLTQTILASAGLRARGGNPMLDAARGMILDTVDGIRLQGFYSAQPADTSRGLVVLLPGWEGSQSSTYMLTCGRFLYRQGYAVFRLNFRDHGQSHHLNTGIFFVTYLDEVLEGVRQVCGLAEGLPAFLVGFSLGGNFALRIARRLAQAPIANLRHVAAISPLLDPDKSMAAIDANPLLRWYFVQKWRRSLMTKQQLFPSRYDFGAVLELGTTRAMTDMLVERFSDYRDTPEYLAGYTLLGDTLADIGVPTTIITAHDDPAIPVQDFSGLRLNALTHLCIQRYGGHCGFIEHFPGKCLYERALLERFASPGTS